jgi:hypothetical protein
LFVALTLRPLYAQQADALDPGAGAQPPATQSETTEAAAPAEAIPEPEPLDGPPAMLLVVPLVSEPEVQVIDERLAPAAPTPPAETTAASEPAPEPGQLLDPDAPPLPSDSTQEAAAPPSLLLDPDAPPSGPIEETPTIAAAPEEWKPQVEFGGEVRTRLGQDLAYEVDLVVPEPGAEPVKRGTEDVVDWRSSAQFWARIKLTENIQSFIELYSEYSIVGKRNDNAPTVLFNGKNYRQDFRLELWEAYFDFFFGPFDLRIGNQIVSWGTMAVMSPSDRINPRDPGAYYWSDISGARDPIIALRGAYHFNDMALEFVWSPFFQSPSLDAYGGDYSLFRYGSAYGNATYPITDISYYLHGSKSIGQHPDLLTTDSPGANPLNSQLGLRFSGQKDGFDFGLSYWFGYEELPTAHLDNEVRLLGQAMLRGDTNLVLGYTQSLLDRLNAGEPVDNFIDSRYRRKHSVAAEFGTTIWELGLKAEAAFLPDRTFYATDLRPVTHHTLAYAAGIDVLKTDLGALSTLFIDVELFGSALFGMKDGERLLFTTRANLGLYTTMRLGFLDDDLELELVNQTNFSTKDYVLISRISYSPVQDLTLTLGVMILEAWAKEPAGFDTFSSNSDRKDTLFGQFSNNDQAFFLLKYRY